MTELAVQDVSPSDIWRRKDELARAEAECLASWAKMDDAHRSRVLAAVGAELFRLIESLDNWVPASVSLGGPGRLDVRISLLLADVDRSVLAKRLDRQREKQGALAELADFSRELAS